MFAEAVVKRERHGISGKLHPASQALDSTFQRDDRRASFQFPQLASKSAGRGYKTGLDLTASRTALFYHSVVQQNLESVSHFGKVQT